MNPKRVDDAMRKAAGFISAAQLTDGGFESFSSPKASPFTPEQAYRTTFAPALILAALGLVDDTPARKVRTKLSKWLLAQKSPGWSFNYWAAASPERKRLPYPDDLDDTFCALLALHQHDPALIDEACLAHVVKLLIATESQVGGPYRTWLVAKDTSKVWQDIDLAVNANIAGFLRLVAEPLPNITALMEQAITAQSFRSPYYPSAYPIIYYIARAYNGPHAAKLASYLIEQRRHGWWGSPLQTALAVSSLSRLSRLGDKDTCEAAIAQLIESQLQDGSWPAEAFCLDPAVQKKAYYSGAAALTTAFVVEALTLCRPTQNKPSASRKAATDKTAERLCAQIANATQNDANNLGPTLKKQTQAMLKRTAAGDADHEIVLLPHFFNKSLIKPVPSTADLFVHLGAANTYGWAAYTIYDDFLDGEGDPKLLSIANMALRYSLQHFREALPDNPAFQELTRQVFDTIDDANAWEMLHCRMSVTPKAITIGQLPRYAATLKLADRSLGHTLTPMAVLAAADIAPSDPSAASISLALRHYIVARQLNDDLHDWEQDLRTGIITYVVAEILRELHIRPGTYTFARLVPRMQRQFWHHTVPSVCKVIRFHTSTARSTAESNTLLLQPNIITSLANKIDRSVEHTISEQSKAETFLAAYRGNASKT